MNIATASSAPHGPLIASGADGNPHDRAFRASMVLPNVYLPFFKTHLPPALAAAIDFESIKPTESSFVDEHLHAGLCDKVYEATFGEDTGYLVLLVEHQSSAEKLMPLRLWRYTLNILTAAAHQNPGEEKPLPLVYPTVLYHNKYPYRYSQDIKDLIKAPAELIEEVWGKPFHLLDLTQIDDETLLNEGHAGVLQYAFKHIWSKAFETYLHQILQQLGGCAELAPGAFPLLEILLEYTRSAANLTKDAFVSCVNEAPINNDARNEVMTVLDQVKREGVVEGIAEGEARGIAKGEVEGKKKVAMQMLRAGMPMDEVIRWTGLLEGTIRGIAEEV